MTVISRRPKKSQPSFSPGSVSVPKPVNDKVYVQGVRQIIASNGSSSINIALNSAGRKLLGISIIPASGNLSDLADTQISLSVNNNNILLGVSANSLNPNFVGNILYLPTPANLNGNDNITLSYVKNNVNAVNATINVFYIPRI